MTFVPAADARQTARESCTCERASRASGRRPQVSATTIEHLRDPADVRASPSDARAEGRLALDTEFVWERTYSPVPCLLQLATAQRLAVLDPLEDVDVGPIAELVGRSRRAARHARARGRPAAVRDALRRARHQRLRHAARGGLRRPRHLDGLRPSRRASAQRHADSTTRRSATGRAGRSPSRRSRTRRTTSAISSTLADALVARLDEMGRRSWAEDEIARRYGPGATIEPDPQRAYLKVARRGRLSGRQLAALRAVAAWREEEARSRDMPPGWVLKDPSVVEVARRNPADAAALGRLRGLGSLSGAAAQRLLDALAGAAGSEPPAGGARARARPGPPRRRRLGARRGARARALRGSAHRARARRHARGARELRRGDGQRPRRARAALGLAARAGGRRAPRARAGQRRLALEPQSPYVRTLPLPPAD